MRIPQFVQLNRCGRLIETLRFGEVTRKSLNCGSCVLKVLFVTVYLFVNSVSLWLVHCNENNAEHTL